MNYLSEFMKKTFPDISERTLNVICFPLPPSPVKGVVFMPDSFSSKNFDGVNFDQDKEGFRPISMTWGEMGIAVLGKVKVSDLLFFDEEGLLKVQNSTCCASSSASTIARDSHEYVDDVVLDGLGLIKRSCHPGSHFSIPEAPFLTALLQWAQSPEGGNPQNKMMWDQEVKRAEFLVKYLSPEEGKIYFPQANYSRNAIVDNYISKCCVGHKVTIDRTLAGVGEWSRPYLKKLRRNILDLEDFYNGEYRETFSAGTILTDSRKENGGSVASNSLVQGDHRALQGQSYRGQSQYGNEAVSSVLRLLEIPGKSSSISGL